ncbi:MAG: LytR/AlgR family response regulator transcription factor [Bacteroidota bacterium]
MMNCIIVDDDHIIRQLIERFIRKTQRLHLLGSFQNPVNALEEMGDREDIDLIFLDVEMPEMSGLEFLENLRTSPRVIIVSGKDKYAINAFDYDVTDYLLKPITYGRFFKAVQRAIDKSEKESAEYQEKDIPATSDEIFIKENSSLIRVKFSDIYYIEAQENYISLQAYDKRHLIHFTMKAIESQLPKDKFVRIHRSYFVNTGKIYSITGNTINVKLKDGKASLPIGKSYKDKLMESLNLMN